MLSFSIDPALQIPLFGLLFPFAWFVVSLILYYYRNRMFNSVALKYHLRATIHVHSYFARVGSDPLTLRTLTGTVSGHKVTVTDIIYCTFSIDPRPFPPWWWLYDVPWYRTYQTDILIDGCDLPKRS